uniref:Pre-mRNA-splicing factor SYF2 n=1 Tax=Pundamilia nyererei TaxID=303518 RepID=A0A3B4F7B5_9CICH
ITSRHCQKILFLFYVAQHNVLSHHPKILWQFYAGFTRIKISKSFAVVQLNFSQFELIIKYRLLIQECAARGEDYNRVKLLDITADDAERWERKKKKKNPDTGFAGYAEAQFRQYQRLTKQIRPDMENYEKQKEESGEDFHPTSNSLIYGTHVPTKDGIDRMVEDVEKQIEKRSKYSRRRAYNDDADIDYINERNAKFNKKAERFYGKYTAEIKQNLERGTAV